MATIRKVESYRSDPMALSGKFGIKVGDNADYVSGQSYVDFLEREYQFYGANQLTVSKN